MRILIADPQPLALAGMRATLEGLESAEIVAETTSQSGLVEGLLHFQADLLILDLALGSSAIALVRIARASCPNLRILICTARQDKSSIERITRAGVDGYVLKTESTASFRQAVRVLCQGRNWFSQKVVNTMFELRSCLPQPKLSRRETDVLRLLKQGLSNREIAAGLCLAEQTVCNYLRGIYEKLDINKRIAVALWARDHLVAI